MKKKLCLILIISFSLYIFADNLNSANAAKTATFNYCHVFPQYPECVGWRTEAINDNYWFCAYVNLEKLCENAPDPQKQIPLRTQDYCCKYIGPVLENIDFRYLDQNSEPEKSDGIKEKLRSIENLKIWTDKDHYNYLDKVIVYGKFDFTNTSISDNIWDTKFAQTGEIFEETFTVDILLSGEIILKDIPVDPNGWFSAPFYHTNFYYFSTQTNLLEVNYTIYDGIIPPAGPFPHAQYRFTTGNISDKAENFKIWVDNSTLPNKIRYGMDMDMGKERKFIELSRHNLVITRLVTPEGYVIPIKSDFAVKDLSTEYSKIREYGPGTYEIQVTFGNNTSKASFEYQIQNKIQE